MPNIFNCRTGWFINEVRHFLEIFSYSIPRFHIPRQWFPNFSGARTTLNILVVRESQKIDRMGIRGPPVVRRADFENHCSKAYALLLQNHLPSLPIRAWSHLRMTRKYIKFTFDDSRCRYITSASKCRKFATFLTKFTNTMSATKTWLFWHPEKRLHHTELSGLNFVVHFRQIHPPPPPSNITKNVSIFSPNFADVQMRMMVGDGRQNSSHI